MCALPAGPAGNSNLQKPTGNSKRHKPIGVSPASDAGAVPSGEKEKGGGGAGNDLTAEKANDLTAEKANDLTAEKANDLTTEKDSAAAEELPPVDAQVPATSGRDSIAPLCGSCEKELPPFARDPAPAEAAAEGMEMLPDPP